MEFSGKFRFAFFAGAYLSTYSGLILLVAAVVVLGAILFVVLRRTA